MRLTLIYPNLGRMEQGLYVDEARMEPLQLGVIAALTPPDVEVVMYDERIEQIPFDEPTDLVGITVHIFTARRAYEISEEYRRRGVPVILGGMHPTLMPDEAARHADSVYIGDAEFVWHRAVEDARRGELQPVYAAKAGPPQPGFSARRDIFELSGVYVLVAHARIEKEEAMLLSHFGGEYLDYMRRTGRLLPRPGNPLCRGPRRFI